MHIEDVYNNVYKLFNLKSREDGKDLVYAWKYNASEEQLRDMIKDSGGKTPMESITYLINGLFSK